MTVMMTVTRTGEEKREGGERDEKHEKILKKETLGESVGRNQ